MTSPNAREFTLQLSGALEALREGRLFDAGIAWSRAEKTLPVDDKAQRDLARVLLYAVRDVAHRHDPDE
jgi:hypothetical protein